MSGTVDDRTRALADRVGRIDGGALSQRDLDQIELLVIDHLGVCLQGARLPWGAGLADWARSCDGTGACPVVGTGLRVPARIAALVNATAAHGLEFDDTHDASVSHPGAVVIATALAVGAEERAHGRGIAAAIVAGYEAMARCGMATGADTVIERGFHPTALFGGFGAASTAARLRGMDRDALIAAWGLLLSMVSGSMQFSEESTGTTVKRLHAGYAAHNGVLATELAAHGLAGPSRALDGRYGLCRLFGKTPDLDHLEGEGDGFAIHHISLKPYPCCRLFHAAIDALEEATGGFTCDPDEIAEIVVGGPAILVDQHMMRRPASMMAAQYALPYTLAAALVDDPRDPAAFAPERLGDPRRRALADRVEAVLDAEMEAAFPDHFGCRVTVRFRNGESACVRVLDSRGTPARPLTPAEVAAKFTTLMAAAGRADDADRALDRIHGFHARAGAADILDAFTQNPQGGRS